MDAQPIGQDDSPFLQFEDTPKGVLKVGQLNERDGELFLVLPGAELPCDYIDTAAEWQDMVQELSQAKWWNQAVGDGDTLGGRIRAGFRNALEIKFGDAGALENLPEGETLDWHKTRKSARKLSALERAKLDDGNEILRFRYLCRGGGALIVGPTGIGKSSLSMQCAIAWALGREAFGIIPARPLRSLFIQAENDDADIAEMRDGVTRGIGLSDDEAKQACDNIFIASDDSHSGQQFFPMVLKPAVEAHEPDLIWIDPALAYLGGEANSQKDVGAFLRNGLNPIIHEHNCAAIVVHHTAKPNMNTAEWSASQLAYLGGGSAEWANWARAILVLDGAGTPAGVFKLHAPKRGGRLRWKEADGETLAFTKIIAHAKEPGVICWKELTGDAATAVSTKAGRRKFTPADVLPHVPVNGTMGKGTLVNRCNDAGIAIGLAKRLIAEAVESKSLYEWKIPRPGTRPAIEVSRQPQPEIQTIDTNNDKQPFVSISAMS